MGTNNLVADLKTSEKSATAKMLQEAQVKNLEQLPANEKLANDLLRRLAELPPASQANGQATGAPSATSPGHAWALSRITKFFIADAYGQEKSTAVKQLSDTERKKLLEKLKFYQLERQKLQVDAKVLREQTQPKPETQSSPLWKQW